MVYLVFELEDQRPMRSLLAFLIACLSILPAYAQYAGGTGEPNDPYRSPQPPT